MSPITAIIVCIICIIVCGAFAYAHRNNPAQRFSFWMNCAAVLVNMIALTIRIFTLIH